MSWNKDYLLQRLGLWRHGADAAPGAANISGASFDPKTNFIAAIESTYQDAQAPSLEINYWRRLPYGKVHHQPLISITTREVDGLVVPDEIWVQSTQIFDASRGDNLSDADTRKKVNRVLEAAGRLNTHLRETSSAKEALQILTDCKLHEVIGEDLALRGLTRAGGFQQTVTPYFSRSSTDMQPAVILTQTNLPMLQTVLGFRLNDIDLDRRHVASRKLYATDPQSGVTYEARLDWKLEGDDARITLHAEAIDGMDETELAKLPQFLDISFTGNGMGEYTLKACNFLGQAVPEPATQVNLLGLMQKANADFAAGRYPRFMDSVAEMDLLHMIHPFAQPPKLSDGGEMLYMSLHGSGHEKVIEHYGDQIGIAALFLHRGLRDDDTVSQSAVAIDIPFASGNVNSNYDGAVPDYMQFLPHISAIFITHDHFDHIAGAPYYAAKGLLKGKHVYCTPEVKYFLKRSMDELGVPSNIRPYMHEIDGEGKVEVKDENGNTRFWVQYATNATNHSARCTPYVVTGCVNDAHYNGSALVYGDAVSLSDEGKTFINNASTTLAEEIGSTNPQLRDMGLTLVLNDVTAVRNEGKAPLEEDVEANIREVFSWFEDKGALLNPFSTNATEYRIGLRVATSAGRNVTAVGANAEKRMTILNLFGVDHRQDLTGYTLPEDMIPADVWEDYVSYKNGFANDETFDLSRYTDAAETDTKAYIYNQMVEFGEVTFENTINGYLMWQAIMQGKEHAVQHATRKSNVARGFRADPDKMMIFVTGNQGTPQERFSTIQKFVSGFSLLDADEDYRPTGYKIAADKFFYCNTQPAIPGNDDMQSKMQDDLLRARNIEAVTASFQGFRLANLAPERQAFVLQRLEKLGWKHQIDAENNIHVYGRPIHFHGHGFRENLMDTVKALPARFHEAHHIPDQDSYQIFRNAMAKHGINHSGLQPNDFQVMRIDAHAENDADAFKKVAKLNPSYVLINVIRKYGQFYRGALELTRATLLRRDGENRADGLAATSTSDGAYANVTARRDWESVSAGKFAVDRRSLLGPGMNDRQFGTHPQSRPIFSATEPRHAA